MFSSRRPFGVNRRLMIGKVKPVTPEMEKPARMGAKLRLMAMERKMFQRFDRCCHGGIVSYRVPLMRRLDAANGRYRD